MKLFTITSTPVRTDKSDENNALLIMGYPKVVADTLKAWDIDGFTMYKVDGYWQGVPEVSFKIEIAIDKDPERVYSVAMKLKELYNQDAVMVTLPNNSVRFV